MKVKIERIKVMKRIRKEVTLIEELAQDIEKNGLINPVTIMLVDNEMYQLLAGLRRLKAVQLLGWGEIDVNVMSPADAEAEMLIEISENEQRKAFTVSEQVYYGKILEEIEKAKAKERMSEGSIKARRGESVKDDNGCAPGHTHKKRSNDAIGKKLGMSGRQYDRVKYIAENAPTEIIEELDKGGRKIRPTYDELKSKEKVGKAKQTTQSEESPVPAESDQLPENNLEPESGRSSKVNEIDVPPAAAPPADDKKPLPVKAPSDAENKSPKLKPLKEPPNSYISELDREAMRKIREFSAMSPEEKIVELQRQLKEERARAAGAESDLARLKELRHNDNLHNNANINNLKMQIKDLGDELTAANARIKELEDKYEPKL